MAGRLASLGEIEAACWHELAAAAGDPAHPWRTPVLATRDDGRADARTVVLREARAPELRIYSDARAPKVAQARRHPGGTLVMWSPALGWQLRCRVRLAVITEGTEVAARWGAIQATRGALDYLSAAAPGASLPVPPGMSPANSTDTTTAISPDAGMHFAIIVATVVSLDWLELHRDGHRRACFGAAGERRWLQP
ncbi:flavin-binding protein [soil metagenome]